MTSTPLQPWVGVGVLLLIATTFGSNHVAARVAFDHGTSVATAVAVRSVFTALFVLALMKIQGVAFGLPAATRWRGAVIGVLLAVQSYCLYSAVARIPVALALLAFNTFPMLLSLLSWAVTGERPATRALIAMPVALAGLALALDVGGASGDVAGRWREIGAGVGWGVGAACAFAGVLFLTTRWLKDVDGRLRTFMTMGVAALIITCAGVVTGGFSLPRDATGWAGLALLSVFYGSAFTALFMVLPRLGTVNNAVVMNFEPIAVLAIAWVVLGQAVAPLQIVGAFIVIGAITLPNLLRR